MAWYNIFYKQRPKLKMENEKEFGLSKSSGFDPLCQTDCDPFRITSGDITRTIDLLNKGVYSQEEINNFPFQTNLTEEQINSAFNKAVDYCNEKYDLKLP